MNNLEAFKAFAKSNKITIRKNSNKVVIYTRVSTKEQAENNHSLDTQKKYCETYAGKNNLEVVAYFGGTYESAKNDERKEFKKMLSFVKNSKEHISSILIYSPDRFSRSGASAIGLAKELNQQNITIKSVLQNSDTTTSSGKLQQNLQFLISEFDNNQRREKCMAGTLEKLRRGEWPAKAPLGYDQFTSKGKQHITINKIGKLLQKAFLWKAEQKLSNVEILEKLKAMGLPLAKQKLSDTFKNPFYCGMMVHNLLEGEVVEGKHEKLISPEVFFQVNEIQSANNHGYTQHVYDNWLPLRKHLICAACGTRMTGYEVKAKSQLYYKCNKNGCGFNKNANHLHRKYESLLSGFIIDQRLIAPLQAQLIATFQMLNKQKEDEVKPLMDNLKEIGKKLERLEVRYVEAEELSKAQYETAKQKFLLERQQILKQLPREGKKISNQEKYLQFSLEMCSKLASMWVSGDYHHRQKLQNLVFPEGVLYDKKKDQYLTKRTNVIFDVIASLSTKNEDIKKGQTSKKTDLSCLVAGTGLLHLCNHGQMFPT